MVDDLYTNYSKVMVDDKGNPFQVRFQHNNLKADFYILTEGLDPDDLFLTSRNIEDIESFYLQFTKKP